MPQSDHELLQAHLRNPSGDDFGALVDRHLPLVHSVARRITRNDEAARDISQTVFLRLIKKASKIPASLPLTAWFHRETHSASVDHIRSEVRRQKREQIALSLDAMNNDQESWEALAPEIDGAIDELPEKDRSLVLLRFYQNKTHSQIAGQLGIKTDAARMRTTRALDKLRTILSHKGITTSAALLATTISGNAVTTPPTTLAATITSTATAKAVAGGGIIAFIKVHSMAATAIAIGLPVIAIQQFRINDLRTSLDSRSLESTVNTRPSRSPRKATHFAHNEKDLIAIFAKTDPAERIESLHEFSKSIPSARIIEALDLLRLKTPEWDSEAKMLANLLLSRWAKEDPEAAFDSLNSADFTKSRGNPTTILAVLAAHDPQRAADWLKNPDNTNAFYPSLGHALAGTISKEWARQDLPAALAWAQSLPDQQRGGAYSGVLGSLASTNPEQASTLALTLAPGPARQHIVGEIASSWARNSPTDALVWAQTLSEQEEANATHSALRIWSQNTPSETAAYLDSLDQEIDSHLPSVAPTWARKEPAKAADWVASQPEGEGRNDAIAKTLWNWTTQNPAAATTWVQEQSNDSVRDHAIAGLATAALDFDPPTALDWSIKITSPKLKNSLIQRSLSIWHRKDAEAAQQWAEDHNTTIK